MEYNVAWGLHRSRLENRSWLTPIQSLSHKVISHVNVLEDVAIKLTAEHYYNDAVTEGRHFTLADLGLAYTWKKVRLTLDWTNILGARLYSSGTLSDLVASHSYYDIRPSAIMLKARLNAVRNPPNIPQAIKPIAVSANISFQMRKGIEYSLLVRACLIPSF